MGVLGKICWEPIVRSPGLGTKEAQMAVGAAEEVAKGLVTLVERKTCYWSKEGVDSEGKGRIKARALPISLLHLTLARHSQSLP